jgi:hypothetical protein
MRAFAIALAAVLGVGLLSARASLQEKGGGAKRVRTK